MQQSSPIFKWITGTNITLVSFPDAYLAQFNDEERTTDWRDWFSPDQRQALFVAEGDGEIVGIALGDPEQHLLPDSSYEAELAMLHVRAAQHSRGIGRQLLQALARHYCEQGIKSIVLITLEKNTAHADSMKSTALDCWIHASGIKTRHTARKS